MKTRFWIPLALFALANIPGTFIQTAIADEVADAHAQALEASKRQPKDAAAWYLLALTSLAQRDGATAASAGTQAIAQLDAAGQTEFGTTRALCGLAAYYGYLFDHQTQKAKDYLPGLIKTTDDSNPVMPLLKYSNNDAGALTPSAILAGQSNQQRRAELALFLAYDALSKEQTKEATKYFEEAENKSFDEIYRVLATAEIKRLDPKHKAAAPAISQSIGIYDTKKIRLHLNKTSPAFITMLEMQKHPAEINPTDREKMRDLIKQTDTDIAMAIREEQLAQKLEQTKDISEYKGKGTNITEAVIKSLEKKYASLKW